MQITIYFCVKTLHLVATNSFNFSATAFNQTYPDSSTYKTLVPSSIIRTEGGKYKKQDAIVSEEGCGEQLSCRRGCVGWKLFWTGASADTISGNLRYPAAGRQERERFCKIKKINKLRGRTLLKMLE